MKEVDQRKINRREFLAISATSGIAMSLQPFVGWTNSAPLKVGMKRPICIFSKHLQFLDYEDMAKTAAEIGFDGVDLTVRPGGHVLPENVLRDFPRAVEAVKKAGLEVYMMTTRITDPDDPNTIPILKTADQLGVRFYRMGYLKYDDKKGIIGSLEAYKPALRKLAQLNKKYKLHGAYQNHSGTRVGGPVWDLYELLKDMDPKYLGVQYDIRHAVVEGGTSWPLGLKLLAPYVKITAIKDFYWTKKDGQWKIQNCPLGEGMVDFPKYFSLVKQFDINGPISLHFEYEMPGEHDKSMELTERRRKTIAVMRKDLETLRRMMKKAGL